jgi:hypothetical protein
VLISCWSVKGGSGTTVVSVAMALDLVRSSDTPVVLADLGGDVPLVLGMPETHGPGLAEWVAAGPQVAERALARLEVSLDGGLTVIPRGLGPVVGDGEGLVEALSAHPLVVADCGVPRAGEAAWALAAQAQLSLLVMRPCYLALHRAVAAPLRPSAVVLVTEPGRSIGRHEVESVLGVPVRAEVPLDPSVARAVDAGLLATRVPRSLQRAIRTAA